MYAFDPELTEPASRLPRVDYADLGTARAAARAIAAHQQPYLSAAPVRVTDTRAPGPPDAPDVPVRLYRPAVAGPVPALLYLHWGGFVIGGVDGVHHTCVRIADQVGALVVSVDYRLAPEHPFPAALDDCHAVLEWVAKEATELGVDADRIGVGGESAGGGLAAALCLAVRDRGSPALRHQCLLFPALDDRLDTVSARAFTDTPMWDRANALVSWGHYLRGRAGAADVPALAAPARATDLSGLPPAFVVACEFDPLRDETIDYAHRLIQAGVRTELRYYPGTFHASIAVAEAAVSRRILADQVAALRAGLAA
ncbi:acetyl esterase/lipase [Micromonospora palomenae]|uniref:Acetyl esterase/lipase n=1 Tax=Micromonospora palomenae TaxID=1461247 RepID=A0A561WU73_9ACTN|nr:alpha/beta hydrolase [Micromonospora palomenae]TWG27426.1 acetyl esterase/lipase [Micromonospora palomenae]